MLPNGKKAVKSHHCAVQPKHCTLPFLAINPRFLQVHIPGLQISRVTTRIKVKKLPEIPKRFWKLRVEVELTKGGTNFRKVNAIATSMPTHMEQILTSHDFFQINYQRKCT